MKALVSKLIIFFISLNKNTKSLILVLNDSIILFLSWFFFFPLPAIIMTGNEFSLGYYLNQNYTLAFTFSLLFYLMLMHYLKGFKEVVRTFSLDNIFPIFFSMLIFVSSIFLGNGFGNQISASYIIFLQSFSSGAIAFTFIIFTRISFRLLLTIDAAKKTKKILIFGIGSAAQELFSTLSFDSKTEVKGFISYEKNHIGREIMGKNIYSIRGAQKIWIKDKSIQLYIASRSLSMKDKQELIDLCFQDGIKVKEISTYSEMLREKEISLKDLNISDLIIRKNLDEYESELNNLEGKRILISGAGGSIGSEIVRILCSIKVEELILVDISEYALFSITEEIRNVYPSVSIESVLCDVKDSQKISQIIKTHNPEIIYHAAAYKHVPILEDKNNFKSAFENNFIGTANLAKAAVNANISKFIFVSTDKAVRPTNLMGVSKRLAELYIQELNKSSDNTILTSVRFGNVIDSSGSVIPTFRKQIKNGGPVTVTHPEIIRYFMTIGEAAYLVIISSIIAKKPGVYMLKMGEPVKIDDIAKRMIKLSGNEIKTREDEEGIEIIYSGLRPGEKLFEELLVDESDIETSHPKIFIDTNTKNITLDNLDSLISMIKDLSDYRSLSDLKSYFKSYADYTPND